MDNELVINPFPEQAQILNSPKRFVLGLAGIQGGKTFVGCIWEQLQIEAIPMGNHLVCALSYDQLNNAVINKFFSLFPDYKKFYNKKEKTVSLPTGGNIFFRSLEDPKYVEGITAHSAWIDEADLIGYKAYLVVRGRVNATGGKILMTSSLADNSWLADYISRLDEKDFEVVMWPSNKNPSFSDAEWESLKKELDPDIFARRYMASPNYATGRVYGLFDFKNMVVDEMLEDEEVYKTFIGIDWGYVDPTAMTVLSLTNKGNIYVKDEYGIGGAPMELILKVLRKFREKYDYPLIYADPSNKLYLKEVALKLGAQIIPGYRDIFYGTSLIRNLIYQDRFFIFKNCTRTIAEMKSYRFKETTMGRSEEPDDKNNHFMDAMRYPLATYPIPKLRYSKKDPQPEAVPFWSRREDRYKRELKKLKETQAQIIY